MALWRFCKESRLSANSSPNTAALLILLGILSACEASNPVTTGCVAGQRLPCYCSNGRQSYATCTTDGSSQSACQCDQGITRTEINDQPTSSSDFAEQPSGGTDAPEQPVVAGTGPEMTQGTGGVESVDAGIEQPQIFDSGQTLDGGPGTSAVDASTQPADSGGSDVQPNTNQDEVPASDHCAPVSNWDPAWVAWEEEVLTLTNEVRAKGADCGQYGSFGPAPALSMNSELRCSARLHSMDMAKRGFFDHTNPDGVDPFTRMRDAGYSGGTYGENIAMGQTSPAQVVAGWVDSDGHCRNIMDTGFTLIGVGYYGQPSSGWVGGHWWTQNFGGAGWTWP